MTVPAFFRFPSRRRLLIYAVVIAALATYGLAFHTYHYRATEYLDYNHDGIANLNDTDIDGDGLANLSDTDADGDGVENHADIVSAARGMGGTIYDYSSGGYNNFFGRCGLLVCIDVPRLAYADAGIYLEQLLRDDFLKHPEHYDTRAGTNTPATPFFFRRVTNLLAYCETNGYYMVAQKPAPGDLLFYGSMHITMVTAAYPDGTYDEIESAPWTGMVVEHRRLRWTPREVGRIIPNEVQSPS